MSSFEHACITQKLKSEIAVIVPPPYTQYIFRQSVQLIPKHSDGGCTTSKFYNWLYFEGIISKASHFEGTLIIPRQLVFDALHQRVRYFQTSVDNSGESILCREGYRRALPK